MNKHICDFCGRYIEDETNFYVLINEYEDFENVKKLNFCSEECIENFYDDIENIDCYEVIE